MVIVRKAQAPPLARVARAAIAAASPMERAFLAARRAGARGEVPVGAAVSDEAGVVLAVRGNRMRGAADACAHAEMLAMADALRRLPGQASTGRLEGCDLWVTLEPCAMCAAAAGIFRVRRILFAAYDPKGGGVDHGARVLQTRLYAHRPEVVGGIREREAKIMLQAFFRDLRSQIPAKQTSLATSLNLASNDTLSSHEK